MEDSQNKQETKKEETSPNFVTPKEQNKRNKKSRKLVIALISVFGIAIVLLSFLMMWKCGVFTPEKYYNVHVLQPGSEYADWKTTVNGLEGDVKVKYMSRLDVVVEPRTSNKEKNYSIFDKNPTNSAIYYIMVSDQHTGTIQWKSSAMYIESGKYHISFEMKWEFDIVLQAAYTQDFEDYIYTINEGTGDVAYVYTGNTLFDSSSEISRVNTSTTEKETIDRDKFDDNLHVGSRIKTIDPYFLSGCTGFNSPIVFQENLITISDCFLYGCSSFNKEIVFPESLMQINGNFMTGCSSFNQPIDTRNIIYMYRGEKSPTFLKDCTSFNSTITIGSKLEQIPNGFLMDCWSFNKDLVIPSTIKHIGDDFLFNCKSMTSKVTIECDESAWIYSSHTCSTLDENAACYTTGIQIAGPYTTRWIEIFKRLDGEGSEMCYRYLKPAE